MVWTLSFLLPVHLIVSAARQPLHLANRQNDCWRACVCVRRKMVVILRGPNDVRGCVCMLSCVLTMYPRVPLCQSPAKSSQPCCVCACVCVCQSVCARPDQYELINRRRQLEGPWGRQIHTWCAHTHAHNLPLYSILSFTLYLLSFLLPCLFLQASLYIGLFLTRTH